MALTKVIGEGVGTLTSGISGTDITLSGGVNIFDSSTDSIDIRGTGSRCEIDNPANNSILLKTGGTTRVRIDANGLLFGSDTAAANALDDYEEGTWTPNIGGDSTYNEQTGKYIKVGHKVTLWFTLRINQRNTPSAPYIVGGNPFTNNTSVGGSGVVHYFNSIQNSAVVLTARIDASGGNINLSGATGSATTVANVNHDWAGNGSAVYGFVTFFSQ